MSNDERLHLLCHRMFQRWIVASPMLDRVRWSRWMDRLGI